MPPRYPTGWRDLYAAWTALVRSSPRWPRVLIGLGLYVAFVWWFATHVGFGRVYFRLSR